MAQSPDIGQNMTGEYPIPEFLIKSFNCNNCRISNNVDKKLDERIRTERKKLKMKLYWQILTLSSFFQLMVDLEQFRIRIPNTGSITFKFSLAAIFHLTQTENRIERSLIQLSYVSLSKATISKNVDISKNKGILVLKGTFSELTYLCVVTCQTSKF